MTDNENNEDIHTDEEVVISNHKATDTFKDVKRVDIHSDAAIKSATVASAKNSEIAECMDAVDNIPVDSTDMYTEEEQTCVAFNYQAQKATYSRDELYELVNKEEFVNNVSHGDKRIGIRQINVNAGDNLSGAAAAAKFSSQLGLGKHTSITLFHSGFTIAIEPPKEADIINLHYNLAKDEYRLGSETNNYIYSNYGVVINRRLVDFILSRVISCSLDLPEDKHYIDFIDVRDLPTLAIGMATSMHPNGYPITVTCKNTLKIEDDKPVCDFTASAKVDPENLLWVRRKLLTPKAMAHISKTAPGSHTVEDVIDYQNSLTVNKSKIIELEAPNGTINVEIKTPNLRKYLESGEMWVQQIISAAEELFTETDTQEQKEDKIDGLVLTSILNKYNSYITKIDTYANDLATITSLLEIMSSDANNCKQLIDGILQYINDNYVSITGTANFDCPVCAENDRIPSQADEEITGFKEIIPLNAVEHFFDLSTLKYVRIMGRQK